jgi:cephalosporin hydroxylase
MNYTANDLDKAVMELVADYDVTPALSHMRLVSEGQYREVQNTNDRANLYYQWLACLVKLLKPQQVVELGAAAGISTMMMATELPEDSILFSVDNDPEIAWKWMDREYPQVVKILGDTRDIRVWERAVNPPAIFNPAPLLSATDVWFFDSLHTQEQLEAELKLYTPFFKKGAVLVFDDIHMNPGMENVWNDLPYDKQDISTPCHWSGFGVAIV